MRLCIIFFGLFGLSACASLAETFKPLNEAQAAALETECGRLPVSRLKGSESPRRIIYSLCKRDALKALETQGGLNSVP